MNKLFALLLIIFVSYSFEDRMRCFDDLDGSPTEKCYVKDEFNNLRYYDSCKNGKVCTRANPIGVPNSPSLTIYNSDGEGSNYGVCAPYPFGGFEGSVCGDNAECFSNNCDGTKCGEPAEFCNMHSECEKGRYCSMFDEFTEDGIEYKPTHKCTDLDNGDCYGDFMCLPLHLCHKNVGKKIGKCKKIGSVENELVDYEHRLLCKSGYSVSTGSGDQEYCVESITDIGVCTSSYTASATITLYDKSVPITSIPTSVSCRNSLLDNSLIPKASDKSISAFKDYVNELNDVEVKKDKKHANYGYIRYHYDKKKVKEALIKAMYPELSDEDDETAECLLDVVKQLQLSGEKIKLSSLLVFAFALLLI